MEATWLWSGQTLFFRLRNISWRIEHPVRLRVRIRALQEDTTAIKFILKEPNINVNLQEPTFGNTILILAVGNDKLLSTHMLLECGANVACSDFRGDQPIHEAVKYIGLRHHFFEILKLLIKYGADVNAVSNHGIDGVPLAGVVDDPSCAKLLIDAGADIYYRNKDSMYIVWERLSSNFGDALYIEKDLIIDKKMRVPNPILIT